MARIFMLFGGVPPLPKIEPKVIEWDKVIGMDLDAMRDPSAVRVLEWGGMEVFF